MPVRSVEEHVRRALDALSERGLLLQHDARRPSLTTLVAGRPVKGSWWGHPAGQRIFQVGNALENGGEVIFVPLVNGKVTLVHRRLWPALVAVGKVRAPWQTIGLSAEARSLLERADREGRVRASGKSAKSLCTLLLVYGEQVHTERGAHATELVSWPEFRSTRAIEVLPRPAEARRSLEEAAGALGPGTRLPWQEPT
jgi:hypothetical protein